jgi:hypothetical protein
MTALFRAKNTLRTRAPNSGATQIRTMEDLSLKLAELQALYDKEHKELENLKSFNNLSITLDQLIGDMSHLTCQEGHFEIRGLQVAYWRYDNPNLPAKPPVIAIHGGPACPHGYILPLKLLAHLGYPVIFYDQAGCGGSTFVGMQSSLCRFILSSYVLLYSFLLSYSLLIPNSHYFMIRLVG